MSYWRFNLADLLDETVRDVEAARRELEKLGRAIVREKRYATKPGYLAKP